MQPVHMQVLNLDFCTLSELPASLGQLTALTTLDVEGNPYLGETFRPDNLMLPPAFPMELSGLQALKYINLNSCGLTSVPEVQPHSGICLFFRINTFSHAYNDVCEQNHASLMSGWFAQARQSAQMLQPCLLLRADQQSVSRYQYQASSSQELSSTNVVATGLQTIPSSAKTAV